MYSFHNILPIFNNNRYGVNNNVQTKIVDAINNWWNDPDGPNHPGNINYPTSGDRSSDDVDYDPWSSSQF